MMQLITLSILVITVIRAMDTVKQYKRMKELESIPYIDVETIG